MVRPVASLTLLTMLTRLYATTRILPYSSIGVRTLADYSGVFGLVGVCITNPYRIPCSVCERAWCIRFGQPATYQSLPASTCKGHWILVRSAAALPSVTMRYHASILGLHRPLTFTSHHLRGDTHEHTVHEPCVVRVMCVLNGLLG